MRLPAAATVLLLSTTGCIKEVSSDERLDRETSQLSVKDAPGAADLQKLTCDDAPEELTKSRNVNRPEAERLMSYAELYVSLTKRTATFEEAMVRNPDLAYQEGSQHLVAAKERCIQETADVKVEFENFVRELVDVPTVQEFKGGNSVTVARLDFSTLRQAIEVLNPDDKDQLLGRVENAEKRVSAVEAGAEGESGGSSSRGKRSR